MSQDRRLSLALLPVLPALLIAASAFIGIAHASMDYIPRPLEKAVLTAEVVARVRITRVTETPCGNDYSATVLKTYKGKVQPALTFASRRSPITNQDREVSRGDELLVLLSPRPPQQEPHDNRRADGTSAPPKAELQCRAKLSAYTPLPDFESAFLLDKPSKKTSKTPTLWLSYDRLRTELPQDIESKAAAGQCKGPFCRVRWSGLERRVLEWTKKGN